MTALDEHCKGTLERDELQNAIFNHYIGMNRTFVAENMKGSKRLFSSYLQSRTQTKRERKAFRKFMDRENLLKSFSGEQETKILAFKREFETRKVDMRIILHLFKVPDSNDVWLYVKVFCTEPMKLIS